MEFKDVFKLEGESYILKYPYARVLISYEFFKKKLAVMIDTNVETLGIFKVYLYDNEDNFNKFKQDHELLITIPVKLVMVPKNIYEKSIPEENEEEGTIEKVKYMVLDFIENSVFFKTNKVIADVKNLNGFTDMIFNVNFPKEIQYDKLSKLWMESGYLNNAGTMKSNSALLDLIVSELYRDKNDLSKPFRMLYKNGAEPEYSRGKYIRMCDIPKYSSNLAAISSADPKKGITASVVRTRKGIENKESPIETAVK